MNNLFLKILQIILELVVWIVVTGVYFLITLPIGNLMLDLPQRGLSSIFISFPLWGIYMFAFVFGWRLAINLSLTKISGVFC